MGKKETKAFKKQNRKSKAGCGNAPQ
jgi:hypothetical protein